MGPFIYDVRVRTGRGREVGAQKAGGGNETKCGTCEKDFVRTSVMYGNCAKRTPALVPVALHFVDAVEGVDLLRPRVVDPVGEDELAEVDVERPASAKEGHDIRYERVPHQQ